MRLLCHDELRSSAQKDRTPDGAQPLPAMGAGTSPVLGYLTKSTPRAEKGAQQEQSPLSRLIHAKVARLRRSHAAEKQTGKVPGKSNRIYRKQPGEKHPWLNRYYSNVNSGCCQAEIYGSGGRHCGEGFGSPSSLRLRGRWRFAAIGIAVCMALQYCPYPPGKQPCLSGEAKNRPAWGSGPHAGRFLRHVQGE